jgi:hypothetical protein
MMIDPNTPPISITKGEPSITKGDEKALYGIALPVNTI